MALRAGSTTVPREIHLLIRARARAAADSIPSEAGAVAVVVVFLIILVGDVGSNWG